MSERTRVLTGAMLGALAGSTLAFFAFTDRGRAGLRRARPARDDLAHTLEELPLIVEKINGTVREARLMVADIRPRSPGMSRRATNTTRLAQSEALTWWLPVRVPTAGRVLTTGLPATGGGRGPFAWNHSPCLFDDAVQFGANQDRQSRDGEPEEQTTTLPMVP